MHSLPTLIRACSAACASAAVVFSFHGGEPATPSLPHPHFPKTVICKVSPELTLTLGYQTVTFNEKAATALAPGKAWHLAGATFETTADVVVGGQKVAAGKYALSARKTAGQAWELVLHEGGGFSTKIGPDAHVLATTFAKGQPRWEHLDIDVQPGGDKTLTKLYLDVRFDTLHAQSLIEFSR